MDEHIARAEMIYESMVDKIVSSKLVQEALEVVDPVNNINEQLTCTAAEEHVEEIQLGELGKALNGNYSAARAALLMIRNRLVLARSPNLEAMKEMSRSISIEEISKALKRNEK